MTSPQFVFVLGSGRCGSSLVQEVLARHPGFGFLTNVQDRSSALPVGAVGRRLYRALPPAASTKGRLRLAPSEGYRVLDREVSPALSQPVRDLVAQDATPWLADRTRSFFERHAQEQGAPVFLHKFTGWPRSGFLSAVWPEARFVHIVRDGRAVANSLLQMPWWQGWGGPERWTFGPLPDAYAQEWEESDRSFVTLAGLEWKVVMDAFAAASARADNWLELRYEDVVQDPRGSCERMLAHAGLPWDPEFERGLSRYTFRTERSAAYRQDLAPADVARLDASLGPHLERYGYV